jgi:hypothetical protein
LELDQKRRKRKHAIATHNSGRNEKVKVVIKAAQPETNIPSPPCAVSTPQDKVAAVLFCASPHLRGRLS